MTSTAVRPQGHRSTQEPSEAPEATPVQEVTPLDGARAFIARYVSLSDVQLDAVTLWSAHTWAFDAAESTPYLAIQSLSPGSGKTLLLEVLELLVQNPWLTGRVTGPCLVRKVDAEKPTLLLDETDTLFTGAAQSQQMLRGVLNSGYRIGGKTSYAVGGSYKDLYTYCPKAFAGLTALPTTVADRSIPIMMKKRTAFQPVQRLKRRAVKAEAQIPRMMLVRFASQNIDRLAMALPEIPEALDDRAADVWEPLLAIADAAGGTWPERARRAAVELCAGRKNANTEATAFNLLVDIKSIFDGMRVEKIKTAALLDCLAGMTWQDDRALDAMLLADMLRGFSITPCKLRFGKQIAQGYVRSAFVGAWRLLDDGVGTVVTTEEES